MENERYEKELEEERKENEKLEKKEKKLRNFQRFIFNVAVILFILWLLFFFVIGLSHAPNSDMNPKIQAGDLLTYYKINKNPSAGDVIVFEKNKTRYVGRVIAKEGDTVEILKKGGVKVNGNSLVEEKYVGATYPYDFVKYPLTLDEDEMFVLVDARETGEDSRYFGPVKKSDIEGVLVGIYRRTGF